MRATSHTAITASPCCSLRYHARGHRPEIVTTSLKTYTLLLFVVCTVSCREKTAPPTRSPEIVLELDDAVRTVAIERAIPLALLVSAPPAQWIDVRAEAKDGRWLEVPTPTTTYPDGELRLYLDHERVAIGVFVGERPLAALSPITRVRVSTRVVTSTPVALAITVRGREHLWNGGAREAPLRNVIGTQDVREVRVVGDTEITLATIDNAILKMNQRGEYVLRVWDNGREHPTREVRRVTKIVVE